MVDGRSVLKQVLRPQRRRHGSNSVALLLCCVAASPSTLFARDCCCSFDCLRKESNLGLAPIILLLLCWPSYPLRNEVLCMPPEHSSTRPVLQVLWEQLPLPLCAVVQRLNPARTRAQLKRGISCNCWPRCSREKRS